MLLLLALLALTKPAAADEKPYVLSAIAMYGYNTTWGSFGGFHFRGELPFNDHFEMNVNAELLTSNVYNFSIISQPKFALPVGEIFLDNTIVANVYQRNRTDEMIMAASIGYRMDYVSIQLGFFGRIMEDMDQVWHSEDSYASEFFNLMYKLQVNVRPKTSFWNIYLGFSNFTELQFERVWQPIFFGGMHYDFKNKTSDKRHWRLLGEIVLKPTGMFHLDASFYGIKTKLGVAYVF